MIKALVFDIDQTLICKNLNRGNEQLVNNGLHHFLTDLKSHYQLYLAVASFNHAFGKTLINKNFSGIFDFVVTDFQFDCSKYCKRAMLQKIRKQYTKNLLLNEGRHTKLRWNEILFFDDNPDVITHTQANCPKLKCFLIDDKNGVTVTFLQTILSIYKIPRKNINGSAQWSTI